MDPASDFNFTATVNDKQVSVDAMLFMAEMALGAPEENQNRQLIEGVRRSVKPTEVAQGLTDAEALALGMRISMRLQQLGKALAP